MSKRRYHPAEVSAERLMQDLGRWEDRFTEAELSAITTLRSAYWRIVEEDEAATGREGADAFAVLYARKVRPPA